MYGTISYLVARRTREIGIRMAMGARQADVLRMVLGETTMLVLAAIVAGLAGAWAVTRYIRFMLHGVSELDPTTFVLTSILLAVIVLIASLWSHAARRTRRSDDSFAGRITRANHQQPTTRRPLCQNQCRGFIGRGTQYARRRDAWLGRIHSLVWCPRPAALHLRSAAHFPGRHRPRQQSIAR